jgi:hypothetical protein
VPTRPLPRCSAKKNGVLIHSAAEYRLARAASDSPAMSCSQIVATFLSGSRVRTTGSFGDARMPVRSGGRRIAACPGDHLLTAFMPKYHSETLPPENLARVEGSSA